MISRSLAGWARATRGSGVSGAGSGVASAGGVAISGLTVVTVWATARGAAASQEVQRIGRFFIKNCDTIGSFSEWKSEYPALESVESCGYSLLWNTFSFWPWRLGFPRLPVLISILRCLPP